jgi:fibronectin-binding autotransporter adhesin
LTVSVGGLTDGEFQSNTSPHIHPETNSNAQTNMKTLMNSRPNSTIRILTTSAASLLAGIILSDKTASAQAISIAAPSTLTQNFDTLGTVNVAWADNTTLPGWYAEINDGATATGNLQAVNGSAATTGLLNLGSTGSGERALGSKVTGATANTAYGVLFQNTSGVTLRITNISYVGELWRSNSVANTPEEWWTSYKVSNALFTDVESGPGNTNPNVGTYTSLSGLNWSLTNAGAAVQLDGNLAANRLAKNVNNPGITLNAGDYFMFRWIDTNEANTDGHQAIDDFSITFATLARNLVWNTAHTVGGAPNGTWDTSANQYWLDGVTPTAFQANEDVTFSQNPAGTAAIDVPADVLAGSITVSHTSGTYSIGGAGLISGSVIKTGSGTLTLTSANAISGASLGGGVTITQNAAALGGGLTVTAASTLQTDTDLTLTGGLSGTGALTKTGAGVLTVGGTGNGTGGVTVLAGKLRTLTVGALGAQNLIVEGAALVFAHAAATEQTLGAATTIGVGATGGEISVENGFVGAVNTRLVINTADRITGSGPITKTGPGSLRMLANHPGLTSDWIINGGTVEYGNAQPLALGTGLVTVNAGGELIGQNTVVPITLIQLNGGALGTRTGNLTDFTGTIGVTADSELRARSGSTPTGQQPFKISGQVTGTGALTITGAIANAAGVIPTGGGDGVSFTNTANDFSGGLHVTARQIGTSAAASGIGSALGSGPITLTSGTVRIRDNGTADGGSLAYGNALTVATAVAPNDIASTIDVDRQLTGTFINNAVQFSALGIAAGSTLNTVGGNGYQVHILGSTTVTGAGDVTFNADSAALALVGGISAGGHGIVKNGVGVLAIGGGSAHTGNTTINAGVLGTNGQLSATPLVDVKAGANLDVALVPGGASFGAGQTLRGAGSVTGSVVLDGGAAITAGDAGVGNLAISGNLNAGTSSLNVTITNGTPTSIVVGGNLSGTGPASSADFFIASNSLAIGTYTLVDYTGVLTGFSSFGIGALPPRVLAGLVDNAANTSIDLSVTGVDFPVWTGAASGAWTTNTIGAPKNWKESASLNATDFINTDRVLFDDTATGTTTVAITDADVTVSGLSFNNSALDYTLDGPFGVAGSVNLDKAGTGKLTINSTNSLAGNVNITGGTVSVGALVNSGVASALGAGNSVNIDNGVLELSAGGSTNRAINIGAAGGTVRTTAAGTPTLAGVTTATGNFTLDDNGTTTVTGGIGGSGGVTLTGSGTTTVSGNITATGVLTKSGTGTAILTGAGNTPASVTIAAGTLQVGDGVGIGSIGTGTVTNLAALVVNNGAAVTVANEITGSGTLTKNGNGQLNLANVIANTNTGLTTVNAGTVVLTSASGIDNIGGDLLVNAGATVAYGTTAGQLQDHVADGATITVNGGTFGSSAGTTPAAPTAGITDTVANVIVQAGGTFLSGRNATVTPFTITGALGIADGTVLVSRGGGLSANAITLAGPGVINLDGGSTTAGAVNASILNIGAGGIQISGANVNLNNGPSVVAAGSRGSIINLGGDLVSTGSSNITRQNVAQTAPLAQIDLGGNVRTFDVTDTLTVGAAGASVDVVNGGVVKSGPGNLVLGGANTYAGLTQILTGTLTLTGSLTATTPIIVDGGALFDVAGVAGGFTLGTVQTLTGDGSVAGAVNIAGTVAPGGTLGTLSFSSTVTFDVGGTGVAEFEISKSAGPVLAADLLSAASLVTYDGTLVVTHTGLALSVGDTFNLFDAPAFAGSFDSFNLPSPGVGLAWETSNLPVDGTISVIPEPGSIALLLGGLALVAARRRRQQ